MSCLFNSLSYFCNYDTNNVRKIICEYMRKDPFLSSNMRVSKTIEYLENKSLEDYLQQMKMSSTWGGAPEIKAFVNLTKTPIFVRNISTNKSNYIKFEYDLSKTEEKENNTKIMPVKNLYNKRIEINWNGYHYESVKN